MRPFLRLSLTAFAASSLSITAAVAQVADPPPEGMRWMQQWQADHEAMLDAKLAGLKAGLKLTPDQEKLWGPFESAAREAADMRMKHMEDRMARMREIRRGEEMGKEGEEGGGEGASPVDRLDRLASRLSEAGAALKKVADAAKPLYDSLDDQQKRVFGFLSRQMMRMGHPGMGMGMERHHRWHGGEEGGPGGHDGWHGEDEGGQDEN